MHTAIGASEQIFQTIYLDPHSAQRIVFILPLFNTEPPGVIALRSLRLENVTGCVITGTLEKLRQFRTQAQAIEETDWLVGEPTDQELMKMICKEAGQWDLQLCYLQVDGKTQAQANIGEALSPHTPEWFWRNFFDKISPDEIKALVQKAYHFKQDLSVAEQRILEKWLELAPRYTGTAYYLFKPESDESFRKNYLDPQGPRKSIQVRMFSCWSRSLEEVQAIQQPEEHVLSLAGSSVPLVDLKGYLPEEPFQLMAIKTVPFVIETKDYQMGKGWSIKLRPEVVVAEIPDLSQTVPVWSPYAIHNKLPAVVKHANSKLPAGIFLQPTAEITDDIPLVRVLLGPNDPYTAERIGSFAFYSTQRGMEWFNKQKLAPTVIFTPQSGQVLVTYFDDKSQKETYLFNLNISDDFALWAEQILAALGAAPPALPQTPPEEPTATVATLADLKGLVKARRGRWHLKGLVQVSGTVEIGLESKSETDTIVLSHFDLINCFGNGNYADRLKHEVMAWLK